MLHGRVTRLGAPVAGAEVTYDSWRVQTRTLDDGSYELPLSLGRHSIEAYSRDLGASSRTLTVEITEGVDAQLDLELELAASISGTVVGLDGTPLPRAIVVFVPRSGSGGGASVHARNDGTFHAAPVTPGEYNALVHTERLQPLALAHPVVVAVPRTDSGITGVRIMADTRTGVVAGRALLADRRPAAGAAVSIGRMSSTTTGPDGRFRLADVPLGPHDLVVRAPGIGERAVTGVETGREDVEVILPAPGTND